MDLESLTNDAFRRGAGISRSFALKSPRYHELLISSPRVPNTTQAETAEMIYLGERLADRAYRNLPYSIRKRAETWPALTDVERHAVLNMLMSRLTSKEWLRIHRKKQRNTHVISEVLPAECGNWSRSQVQPNCLGLTQMLIGFARATGAEHLMVDVVTQFDYFNEQLVERTCRSMIELLRPHDAQPALARLIRKLEWYRERGLRALADMEDTQAHHALLIKIGNDWIVVDPYLGRKYAASALSAGKLDVHGTIMRNPRRRWMLYGARAPELDCRMAVDALRDSLEYFARRDETIRSFKLTDVVIAASAALCWIDIDVRERKVTKAIVTETREQLATVSALTRSEVTSWEKGALSKGVRSKVIARYERARHRKRDRNLALLRLIKQVCLLGLDVPYRASKSRKAEHRRIEIGHPTLHLAVTTLNHMGHVSHRSTAELIRFSSSQWILHDTLREVRNSGDKRLNRIAEGQLRKLAKHAHHAMPILLTEHNKRK